MLLPLPFDTPQGLKPLQVEGLNIPQLGCLTVSETRIFQQILESGQFRELQQVEGAIARLACNQHIAIVLATILLISRDDQTWTLELVSAELQPNTVNLLAEFFLNERDRWGNLPKAKPSGKPVEINWASLYWRLRLAYPNEARFTAENFGNCPLIAVEQALETLNEQELQAANRSSLPIALLGMNLLAAQGVEGRLDWFSPFYKALAKREALETYPQKGAQTFLKLAKEGRVPGWAIALVDMHKLDLAAEEG